MSSNRSHQRSTRRQNHSRSVLLDFFFPPRTSSFADDARDDSLQEPVPAQPERSGDLPPDDRRADISPYFRLQAPAPDRQLARQTRTLFRSPSPLSSDHSPAQQPAANRSQPQPRLPSPGPLPSFARAYRPSLVQPSGNRPSRTHQTRINGRLQPRRRRRNASFDEVGRDLDYANSHLRAILDLPAPNDLLNQIPPSVPSASTPTMASRSSGAAGSRREPSRTTEDSGRVSKRRKLDAEKTGAPSYTAFRYGRYGQVEPGALTMEIVSCDGGLYSGGSSYAAENILKNDNSVYCTKGNRCNIVLQHQGCTTFSLKELIIKAPGRNYSSPVKAGMVYLSMSKDELLRAEQYNANDRNMSDAALDQAVQEVCARASSSSPLLDYLSSDTFRSMGARIMVGNSTDNSDATRERQIQDMRRLVETARESLMQDAARAQQSTGQDTTTQLGFVVLTECSDDEDYAVPGATSRDRDPTDLEWRWSPTPLRNRPRRRLPVYDESTPLGTHLSWEVSRYRDNDDDEDDEDEDDEANEDEDEEDYTDAYQLDLGNPTASSPDSLPNESEDAPTAARSRAGHSHHSRDRANSRSGGHGFGGGASATDSINRAPLHGRTSTLSTRSLSSRPTSLPHAEFHIEPGKNKCTIVFDPPVTARYILLKMWNPSVDYDDNSNIDIQGVVAKGFAGPRYFPAMELR